MNLTVSEYLALAAAGRTIYDGLASSRPTLVNLTPAEKAEVDKATLDMNTAVAGWDAAAKP